jgi:CheY-like chemotaxis protein
LEKSAVIPRIELPYGVIVDISMPDLDGLQATRQIRQATPNTDVVVLTMHESDQMVRLVLDAGALGYVLKSDLAAHLVKAVKDVSAGKLFLTPRESEIVLKGFLKTGNQPNPTEHSQARPTPREVEIIRLLAEENRIRRLLPSYELLSGRWRHTEQESCSSLACIPSPNSFTRQSATGLSQRHASQNNCGAASQQERQSFTKFRARSGGSFRQIQPAKDGSNWPHLDLSRQFGLPDMCPTTS